MKYALMVGAVLASFWTVSAEAASTSAAAVSTEAAKVGAVKEIGLWHHRWRSHHRWGSRRRW
jgi:hypothetical protein